MQWGIFVWNRVREIRLLTSFGTWRYVPGELNPADLPSRGCQAKQLFDSRWWEGPNWLREAQDHWPSLSDKVDEDEVNGELKKSAQISMLNPGRETEFNVAERFSSYNKMIRFLAIMLRFKNFKLKKDSNIGTRITYQEMYQAELKHLKYIQEQIFLSKNDPKLMTIQTFVHTDGLIRLKTKIFERNDRFSFLCPILLDKHKTVELLIRETHENMCHAGAQTVMCKLREKFWILSMRRIVRSVISKCVVCKRYSTKNMKADSPPLIAHRVRDAAIFEITRMDFAGPVFLRGRQKAWICLFTCAVYQAVHLELVTSLSTKTFLDSLRRFIARRGRPSIVYTDNGTNFVGADAFKKLN
ncbi:uncharacterized protein LOC143210727 [Lasioglossum baleicum]|uniref:uncharacterized protein LOC143210727 n=1 Tax=Lasioglossum baleicum TaxID=434251 RepID=UPI003FCDD7DD